MTGRMEGNLQGSAEQELPTHTADLEALRWTKQHLQAELERGWRNSATYASEAGELKGLLRAPQLTEIQ